jgi:hemolysin activation/secretion protein
MVRFLRRSDGLLRSFKSIFFLTCGVLSVAGECLAQATPPPGAGSVGHQQIRATQNRADALANQNVVPSLAIPPQVGDAPLTQAQQRMVFLVSRIDVEGSTVFDSAVFAPLLAPHLGRPNTLAELRGLTARISEAYAARGYPFTRVSLPGQEVLDGRVRLQVREFRVTSVVFDLEGNQVDTPAGLRTAVAAILAERPARRATLEAAQREAARLPNLRVATTRFDQTRGDGIKLTVFLVRPGDRFVAIQPPGLVSGADDAQRIGVREIRFAGNRTLSDAALAPEAADVIGRDVTLRELRAVAGRITARYAAAGYFGTEANVPAQVVRDGVVTIEVRELSISRVNVFLNGRPLPPEDRLSRMGNAVTSQQPDTLSTVQRQLYVLQNTPGVFLESVIPPTIDSPEAEVYLRRAPITFTTAMDNRGDSVGGPLQWGGMITTNGLLGLGEQVQLQALTSLPFGEVRFFGGMLIVPLSDNGLVGVFQASRSEAFPGGYLKPLNIAAFGDMYSFGLNYPLITRPGLSVVGTTSIDLFDNTSTVFGGEITSSDERSRAFRLGAIANVDDLLGGQSIVRLIFSQGLEALGARPTGNQVNTRPGMELDASKVVFEINRKQPLPSGFQVDVGMLLQRANGPLPSAEVFDFGGVMYGRAYDSGIISGDHGLEPISSLGRCGATVFHQREDRRFD